jgi:hypothetical protein
MYEQTFLNFLTALGEEFTWALSPPVDPDLIVPHDGYEAWLRAFKTQPSPTALAALTAPEFEHLTAVCAAYCECPTVSTEQVGLWINRTLDRWPVEND